MRALPRRLSVPPAVRVVALSILLIATWPLALLIPPPPLAGSEDTLTVWLGLVVLMAGAELWVFQVRIRHEQQSVSMSELPLVIGLFTLSPVLLVFARVVGCGLVFGLHRRTAPLKTLFNLAEAGAVTVVAAAVFAAASAGAPPVSPQGAFAALLAVAVAGVFDELVIDLGISIYDGWQPFVVVMKQAGTTVGFYLIAGAGGVAVTASFTQGRAAWPALILGVLAVLLGFRSYAALRDRHGRLERLFHLSTDLNNAREVGEVGQAALTWAVEMLGADSGQLLLVHRPLSAAFGAGSGRPISSVPEAMRVSRWTVKDGSDPVYDEPSADDPTVVTPLQTTVRHWSASERTGTAEKSFLEAQGWREALCASLEVDEETFGCVIVGENVLKVSRYREADVQLLETLANHTTVALRHGRVMDRLSYEAKHDRLTGLPNRSAFQSAADKAVADLETGRPFAISTASRPSTTPSATTRGTSSSRPSGRGWRRSPTTG
jgi:hypothetical protein